MSIILPIKSALPMNEEQEKVAEFTRKLAINLDSLLAGKKYDVNTTANELYRNTGFIIHLKSHEKHKTEVMVSEVRERKETLLVHVCGVRPIIPRDGGVHYSTPEELRTAAGIYEEVNLFLNKKFGEPFWNNGPILYYAPLEEKVASA